MKVCVGTRNPSKVKGVEEGFREVFRSDGLEVKFKGVKSGVPPQPIGLEMIVMGARNRAVSISKALGNCDYSVGIEAGIFVAHGTVMDVQIAYVIDSQGRESMGFSPAFPLPRKFGEALLAGRARELEVLVDEFYGTKDIGDKGGFIKLLTRSAVLREDLTKYAVIMALLPWINAELYELR